MEILSRGDALRVLTFTKEEAVGKRAQVVGGSVLAGQCLRVSVCGLPAPSSAQSEVFLQ